MPVLNRAWTSAMSSKGLHCVEEQGSNEKVKEALEKERKCGHEEVCRIIGENFEPFFQIRPKIPPISSPILSTS